VSGWSIRYSLHSFRRSSVSLSLRLVSCCQRYGGLRFGADPGGILGDRIGEGRILVISSVISGVAIAVVAASIDVWMLFVGTIGFGFATALFGPTRFTVFTDLYSKRTGSAIGLTMAAGRGKHCPPGGDGGPRDVPDLAFELRFPHSAVRRRHRRALGVRSCSNVERIERCRRFLGETITHILESISGNSIPVVVAIQMCFRSRFRDSFRSIRHPPRDVKDLSPSGDVVRYILRVVVRRPTALGDRDGSIRCPIDAHRRARNRVSGVMVCSLCVRHASARQPNDRGERYQRVCRSHPDTHRCLAS